MTKELEFRMYCKKRLLINDLFLNFIKLLQIKSNHNLQVGQLNVIKTIKRIKILTEELRLDIYYSSCFVEYPR